MSERSNVETLNVGTKEIVSLDITDRLGGITSLATYNVEYKIVTEDEATIKVNWTTVLNTSGMRADILVDTTTGGGWAEGTYKLYIRINIIPEIPVLGPFEFGLS